MRLLLMPRASGKTGIALDWVAQGHPLPHFGWSRVLLVSTAQEESRLRDDLTVQLMPAMRRYRGDVPVDLADDMSMAHIWATAAIARIDMWANSRGRRRDIELAIDELDSALTLLLGQEPVLATMTPEEGPL